MGEENTKYSSTSQQMSQSVETMIHEQRLIWKTWKAKNMRKSDCGFWGFVDFLVKLPPRPLNNTVLNESFDKVFGGKIQIPSHVL